jgi:hypothetical protein
VNQFRVYFEMGILSSLDFGLVPTHAQNVGIEAIWCNDEGYIMLYVPYGETRNIWKAEGKSVFLFYAATKWCWRLKKRCGADLGPLAGVN